MSFELGDGSGGCCYVLGFGFCLCGVFLKEQASFPQKFAALIAADLPASLLTSGSKFWRRKYIAHAIFIVPWKSDLAPVIIPCKCHGF